MEMQVLFATLADPTRFRIVELLRDGERAVSELVREGDVHQSGVSRHLGILLAQGFVQVRRDGQHRRYSLRPDPFREVDAWIAAYRALWGARLDRLETVLKRKAASRDDGTNDGGSQ